MYYSKFDITSYNTSELDLLSTNWKPSIWLSKKELESVWNLESLSEMANLTNSMLYPSWQRSIMIILKMKALLSSQENISYQVMDKFNFEKIASAKSSKEDWNIMKKAYKEC